MEIILSASLAINVCLLIAFIWKFDQVNGLRQRLYYSKRSYDRLRKENKRLEKEINISELLMWDALEVEKNKGGISNN